MFYLTRAVVLVDAFCLTAESRGLKSRNGCRQPSTKKSRRTFEEAVAPGRYDAKRANLADKIGLKKWGPYFKNHI